MTRDEATRAVVDAAEGIVNNHRLAPLSSKEKLVQTFDLERLAEALKAYWGKEGEEE